MSDSPPTNLNPKETASATPVVLTRRKGGPPVPQAPSFPDLTSVTKKHGIAHLVELGEDLLAIATTTEKYTDLVNRFLNAAVIRGRLLCATWIEFENGQQPKMVDSVFKNSAMNNQTNNQILFDSAASTIQLRRPQVLDSDKVRGTLTACVPVFKNETTTAIICGIFPDIKTRSGESLAICQSLANYFDLWRSRDQMTEMAVEVRSVATVLELVGKAENHETLKGACVTVANELQKFFRCDYVAVGIKKKGTSTSKLMAVSALSEFDHQSRTTTLDSECVRRSKLAGETDLFSESSSRPTGGKFIASPETGSALAMRSRRYDAFTKSGRRDRRGDHDSG